MSHLAPVSFKVAATLTAYRGVTSVTGTADTVKYPASALERPLGITTNDVKNITDGIPVCIGGITDLTFNDSCASGKMVALDSAGRGVVHVDTTAGSYVIGVLVGPDVQTAGQIGQVLVQPHFKSIP